MTQLQREALQRALLAWYAERGRSHLPWRRARSAYFTVVSEFMLQQTQVERVAQKFDAFIERFPSFEALARASVADVLRAWQGLGYNSRALRLRGLAENVVREHAGALPCDTSVLRKLPGVGAYTAAAIRAFAFDLDDAPVDTNVRRILHRYAYGAEYPSRASMVELDTLARDVMSRGNAHDWNSALMDLGASICTARNPQCRMCPLAATCVAAPLDSQRLDAARRANVKAKTREAALPFERTRRYARGRIVDRLRALPPGQAISLLDLHYELRSLLLERTLDDLGALIVALERDGLVERSGERVALRD